MSKCTSTFSSFTCSPLPTSCHFLLTLAGHFAHSLLARLLNLPTSAMQVQSNQLPTPPKKTPPSKLCDSRELRRGDTLHMKRWECLSKLKAWQKVFLYFYISSHETLQKTFTDMMFLQNTLSETKIRTLSEMTIIPTPFICKSLPLGL